MENKHKPLHDIEKRALDGSEKKGHREMNDALRKANPRTALDTKDAGFGQLSEKSVGDEYRARQKQHRLAALERHRKSQ